MGRADERQAQIQESGVGNDGPVAEPHRPDQGLPDIGPVEQHEGDSIRSEVQEAPVLLLRRWEHSLQQAVTEDSLRELAPTLVKHCVFCNQWISQAGAAKEHIKRMHLAIWDCAVADISDSCLNFNSLLLRNHDCPFCGRMVYGMSRHAQNCVVLAQVVVARAWYNAGRPEQTSDSQAAPTEMTRTEPEQLIGACLPVQEES